MLLLNLIVYEIYLFFPDSRELSNSASCSQEGSHKRQSTLTITKGQAINQYIV